MWAAGRSRNCGSSGSHPLLAQCWAPSFIGRWATANPVDIEATGRAILAGRDLPLINGDVCGTRPVSELGALGLRRLGTLLLRNLVPDGVEHAESHRQPKSKNPAEVPHRL